MEKLFEKIGDHFNNPEMSDRILVVKIRRDGWEKLEAARRVKMSTKTNSDSYEETNTVTNDKSEGLNKEEEYGSDLVAAAQERNEESTSTSSAVEDSIVNWESRTTSSLSCDSGIGGDTLSLSSETKRNVKSKKREESMVVFEKEASVTNDDTSDPEQQVSETSNRANPDLVVAFNKLLLTDIRYADKAGAIGLTAATDSSVISDKDEACISCTRATENSVLETSNEDLALTDTIISEKQLCVHSFWLALNSSYFRSLFFSSGMKETKVKKVGDCNKGVWITAII